LVAGTRSSSIFKRRRIAEAVARRGDLSGIDAYRLIHGVADGVPGLFVDRFGDVLVVHADSEDILDDWQPALHDLGTFPAAVGKVHPRQASRLPPVERVLWGAPPAEVFVRVEGVRYVVRLRTGLSVGLFLDMREVRQWIGQIAGGRNVLNLFAYTCSFGVVATLAGAIRVLNLDLSRSYLDWGRANYQANALSVDDADFVFGDAFDWLGRFARRNQLFELVIVDPPSFSSTRRGPFAVERAYERLVTAAARTIAPGGILLAATNHGATTDARFDAWLRSGLDSAGRRGRLERSWHEPPPDFPLAPGQQPYLKVRALTLD
jgi:23S rRNA (cytosine1962-C5)-methyltransferase